MPSYIAQTLSLSTQPLSFFSHHLFIPRIQNSLNHHHPTTASSQFKVPHFTMNDDRSAKADAEDKHKEPEPLAELSKGELIPGAAHNWTVLAKVGEGAFGGIYKVSTKDIQDKEFAMKIEAMNSDYPVLKLEVNVIKALMEANAQHACQMVGRGINKKHKFNFIVMTLLDNSISGLLKDRSKNKFSLCTAVRVGAQMLTAIRELHAVGYLHRDLKPANFGVGRGAEQTKVFMIDYGMCRKYRKENGTTRFPRTTAEFRGTEKYAPLVAHLSMEQSRKDEIEAWLYIVLEMMNGKLPWDKVTDKNEFRQQKKDARSANNATSKALFAHEAKDLREVLARVDKWAYHESPEYDWVLGLLRRIHAVHCCADMALCPKPLDWMAVHEHRTQDTATGRQMRKKQTVSSRRK